MRDAGVPETQTLAAFIHDTQQQLRGGERTDFSNVLFLVDESSMVGNADMAKAYSLIAGAGARGLQRGYRPAAVHCPGPALPPAAEAQRH
jgi:ATP-dependent exoDNAse (exonuclease V) alpha subunit